MTLIYKIKANGVIIKPEKIYFNKYSDFFSFIVPVSQSLIFSNDFILYINDPFADNSSVEFCKVVDKKYSDNKCKISFVVKSKGMRFLQSTIQSLDYWED